MKGKKIAVVMGGPSTERDVSLNTGNAVLKALLEKGYNAIAIDLEPNRFVEQIREAQAEVVFNAVHGKFGEDGVLQGTLELMNIPYTGSGVLASAVCMDKSMTKLLFTAGGIPTPSFKIYDSRQTTEEICQSIIKEFQFPLVVKASEQGSSIGVHIVDQADHLQEAVDEALRYSGSLIVEAFIVGRELTAAVMGDCKEAQALPVIEIRPHSGRYDYHSKYTKGATEYLVPAPLEADVAKNIQTLAVKAFQLAGCQGVARVDFMLTEQNEPFALEINTVPGMTATSLVPKAAAAMGLSFENLCDQLLKMAH